MIYELLSEGEQNARTGKDLCKLLDMTPRELTAGIERERREGKPICASYGRTTPGYFLAANREEMERYCGQLRHRAGEIFKTRRACLKTMEGLPTRGRE